jgi:hypothetical protein
MSGPSWPGGHVWTRDAFGAMLAGREYLYAWPWAVAGLRKRAERVLREAA